MPEGPEIRLASNFINKVASCNVFGGKIIKGEKATKLDDVPFSSEEYTVKAESRGKELKVHLIDVVSSKKKKKIKHDVSHLLFRFGMSGCFKFTKNEEELIPKHAHLRFITKDEKFMLSFVDYRRFGRWSINGDWGKDRGPDPISNYEDFRTNILTNIEDKAFNVPICEVMLNQKYFNGIGNYLRAEILYRCSIPPFEVARDVLSPLSVTNVKIEPKTETIDTDIKQNLNDPDILQLCNIVPNEVLALPTGGKGYDVDHDPENEKVFTNWLQCYSKDGMQNLVDKNGRTIWFLGSPGKLKPQNAKSRGSKMTKRAKVAKDTESKNDVKLKLSENMVKQEIKSELTEISNHSSRKNQRKEVTDRNDEHLKSNNNKRVSSRKRNEK